MHKNGVHIVIIYICSSQRYEGSSSIYGNIVKFVCEQERKTEAKLANRTISEIFTTNENEEIYKY
jgi:hypothetical protein